MLCNMNDRDVFVAATIIHIRDGCMAKFWESSRIEGMRLKDIAPKIFDLSENKSCYVQKALLFYIVLQSVCKSSVWTIIVLFSSLKLLFTFFLPRKFYTQISILLASVYIGSYFSSSCLVDLLAIEFSSISMHWQQFDEPRKKKATI